MTTDQINPSPGALNVLYSAIEDDLDEKNGGCSWWHGYQDWPRLALINDYLLGSVQNLLALDQLRRRHEQLFNERWTSEAYNMRMAQQSGQLTGRTQQDERRRLDIAISIRGFFEVSTALLDQLAAVLAAVAAVRVELKPVSWGLMAKLNNACGHRNSTLLYEHGTAGRDRQEKLIRRIRDDLPRIPGGWLEWTINMRNATLHRAGRKTVVVQSHREHAQRATAEEIFMVLPSDPLLTETEAFSLASDVSEIFLSNHAADLMRTISNNLTTTASLFSYELTQLWTERRANPKLLVQPGQQWPTLPTPSPTPFTGVEKRIAWPTGGIILNPSDVKRFNAAKVSDADAPSYWQS